MKKTGKIFFNAIGILLLTAPLFLSAVEAEVTASINADKIGLDDTLIYTLTFKNINNPIQPDLAYWDDFKTLQHHAVQNFSSATGQARLPPVSLIT
jgi:hypothetical protein